MSRLMITSDLHLGHNNICKFRPFESAEEHHEILFDNLATNINKRDSLLLLGDIAFNAYWLKRLDEIKCVKKTLILGNHDTEKVNMKVICQHYDAVHSLYSKRNNWFSHCPIHSDQFRDRKLNIHGHLHDENVLAVFGLTYDKRYFNACVEHTDYKPISYSEIIERTF